MPSSLLPSLCGAPPADAFGVNMHKVVALLALAPLIGAACGGTPPPTHDVTALPSASATASAAPAIDMSPVPMPEAVVALVHAAHVGATSDMVAEWAGQPVDLDVQLADMVGEHIAKLVDLDAASDMAIIAQDRGERREPEVRIAVSLAVKSFDSAKTALLADYGLLPLSNGAFEITRTGSHHHEGDHDFRSCALAPSLDSGGRIVCSRDPTSRDMVVPYLTRGLGGMKTIRSDVHVEARPGPFREIVRRERASISQSGARFMGGHEMRAVWEMALADLCDSFLDADRATLDASIDAKMGSMDVKVTAKGASGTITRLLTGHPDRAEPPPQTYMRLPADADIAFFGHGLDVAELTAPKAVVLKALEGELADEPKLKDADRKATLDALGHTMDLMTAPVLVYARGVDFSKAIPAVSGLTESSDAAKIKAGLEQAAGWEVLGADLDPTKVTAAFKEWSAVLARPQIMASIHDDKTVLRMAGSARNAPPGTVQVTIDSSHDDWDATPPAPGAKPKKRSPIVLTLHVLIVPDQGRVWVVTALDEATAVAKAKALVAGTSTLANRTGLDALKAGRLNAGGFITPRGVGLGTPWTWLFTWNPRYKAANDPLMGISSQSQYTTPVVLTATESGGSGEGTLTFALRFPRPGLQEVLQVGPRLFR